MKNNEQEITDLVDLKNFVDYNQEIKENGETFQKVMCIYKMALKELNNKVFNTYKSPTETANINIYALPFFISKSDENFKKEFNNFFGNN